MVSGEIDQDLSVIGGRRALGEGGVVGGMFGLTHEHTSNEPHAGMEPKDRTNGPARRGGGGAAGPGPAELIATERPDYQEFGAIDGHV